MRITTVEATSHYVPWEFPLRGDGHTHIVVTRIETDEGLVGHGFNRGSDHVAIRQYLNHRCAPEVLGEDPRNNERLWHRLLWKFNQRIRTGVAAEAICAIDMALWDIRAQAAGMPLYQLLGGARDRVPVYSTFGMPSYDRDELVEVARLKVGSGHNALKMVVADRGAQDIPEDIRRVQAVREAVGPDVALAVDANCLLDYQDAVRLARRIEQFDIAWFEEPVHNNEPHLLARLREATTIPISSGQCESFRWDFRELMARDALDLVQVDVGYVGGYTEGLKVAALAQAFHLKITSHGWPLMVMHLIAGIDNGKAVEYHLRPEGVDRSIFTSVPEPAEGWVDLPRGPGIGVEVDEDFLQESLVP